MQLSNKEINIKKIDIKEIVSPRLTIEQCRILGHLVTNELYDAEAKLSVHPINALKTLIDVLYDVIHDLNQTTKQKLALVQYD